MWDGPLSVHSGSSGHASCPRRSNEPGPGAVEGAGEFEDFLFRPFGRVEPGLAQGVQFPRGGGDGLHFSLNGGIVLRFLPRRPREGEGLEAGRGRVARAAGRLAQLRGLGAGPDLVNPRVEDAEEIVVRAGEDEQSADRAGLASLQPSEESMLRDCWVSRGIAGSVAEASRIPGRGSTCCHQRLRYVSRCCSCIDRASRARADTRKAPR